MNLHKKILILVSVFLLVQIVSAEHIRAPNQNRENSENVLLHRNARYLDDYSSKEYEGPERFPLYDYRYGYSYRATREYRKNSRELTIPYRIITPNIKKAIKNDVVFQETPEYYYEYVDYLRTYVKHECYVNPPKNKLFYIRCP